jgi:hypothetical protein
MNCLNQIKNYESILNNNLDYKLNNNLFKYFYIELWLELRNEFDNINNMLEINIKNYFY